jgi:Flp pilus assembly protein TadD
MPTISEALSIAIAHQRAGRLDLAEGICRRIIEAAPDHADALHFAGLIAYQQGRYEEAVKRIVGAINVDGRQPGFHSNLGEAYRALGRLDEAVACYRRAIELNPALPQAYNNLV